MKGNKMKTVKMTEEAWEALAYIKINLKLKTLSDAVISVIHTAIVNIYNEMQPGDPEPKEIKELEKIIKWKRP